MRVLFSLLDAGVGGGQQVALDVAGELRRRGHEVGVVVPEPGPATERFGALGAETHVAPLVSLRRPGVARGARIARAYDVVYSHTSVPGEILGGIAASLARRPHAVHRHVYPHFSPRTSVRAAQHVLYRTVLRRARIAAVAEHIADDLAAIGIPRSRIAVIPNGVVVPDEPAPTRAAGSLCRIGLLGRLDPQKGADVFVEARGHLGADAEVVLGAPSSDGDYADELLPAARAANISIVIPAGSGFLESVDIVAIPSRYEGHPLTLLEAMALGKAIVASSIPGIREVLAQDVGLLVPPGNAHALASALRRLVADPELCRRLGARAREVAASQYGLEQVHERLISFLEETAARAPS